MTGLSSSMESMFGCIRCNKCFGLVSELRYQFRVNDSLHLLGYCCVCGWRFLPFVLGLKIKTVESKARLGTQQMCID